MNSFVIGRLHCFTGMLREGQAKTPLPNICRTFNNTNFNNTASMREVCIVHPANHGHEDIIRCWYYNQRQETLLFSLRCRRVTRCVWTKSKTHIQALVVNRGRKKADPRGILCVVGQQLSNVVKLCDCLHIFVWKRTLFPWALPGRREHFSKHS